LLPKRFLLHKFSLLLVAILLLVTILLSTPLLNNFGQVRGANAWKAVCIITRDERLLSDDLLTDDLAGVRGRWRTNCPLCDGFNVDTQRISNLFEFSLSLCMLLINFERLLNLEWCQVGPVTRLASC